jgi:energy-coupling factor transporter ATP-binding protein EcfA2
MSEGLRVEQGLDAALPRGRHGYDPGRDRPRSDRVDADSLVARAKALGRFVRAAGGVLDADRLAPARALTERTGQRLAHSREHTVVALAGATGGGKSSLFNALSGLTLSDVGVRRPTTGYVHACVWGSAGAVPLLDWLDVPAQLRFDRESALDAEDEAGLRGLVLLDLPDLDSVAAEHRNEAERMLDLVDLVVWVTDPQKYADRLVHDYLRTFTRLREITVVVLNQADRLTGADIDRCVADLRRLLDADGLGGIPVLPTSAANGRAGVVGLRRELEKAVVARQAQLRRLDGDLHELVEDLSDTIGPPSADIGRSVLRGLAEALCSAAGAPAVANAVARAYRYQAGRTMGWPLARYWRRQQDPLAWPYPEQTAETSALAVPARAQRAAVDLAVRGLAERAGGGLPEPWASAIDTAARSRLGELPGALDAAIDHVDLGPWRTPPWWRVLEAVQWLLTLAALAGVGWLIGRLFLPGLGGAGRPALLAGTGLLGGLLLSALVTPFTAVGSRTAGREASGPLESAVTEVASEYVIRPVRAVSTRYGEAREALEAARR